jgi:glucose dehydrogenase
MRLATILISSWIVIPALHGQNDWPAYGGDLGNTRYSALDQINVQNVTKISQAWLYNTHPPNSAAASRGTQSTPLVVNGVLYMVTSYQTLVALDPETGKPIWVFHHSHGARPPRGIGY